LAASGVGDLTIIDADKVELSNLPRQPLYGEGDVGHPKVQVAARRLQALNSCVRIKTHDLLLTADNAASLLQGADIVLDGSDNFASRYSLARACAALRIPLISAALLRFEAQLTCFAPWQSPSAPCLHCLYPHMPQEGAVPNCTQAGIFAPLAGMLGVWAAGEALKQALGIGESLIGRLLLFDLWQTSLTQLHYQRQADCPYHG
jgi:molybdopterin-synthase adenylyltransferase